MAERGASTVRRIVESYCTKHSLDPTGVHYVWAHGKDTKYLFLWFVVDQDRQYFLRRYNTQRSKGQLSFSLDTSPPRGRVDYLSHQQDSFPDPTNPRIRVVPNHFPYDITAEELSRVVEERCGGFAGDNVRIGKPARLKTSTSS